MTAFLEPTPMPNELTRALTLIHGTVLTYELYVPLDELIRESLLDALETVRRHLVGIRIEAYESEYSGPAQIRGEGWSL